MTDKPAEEWMQKAREVHVQAVFGSNISGAIEIVARALMSAADAATERAASWHDNQAVEIEMSSKRVNGKMMTRKPLWHRQCAAAIRKGTHND